MTIIIILFSVFLFDRRQLLLDGALNIVLFRLSLPSLLYNITFFLLSKHDFHNTMFVLNSWHYFKVQCMPNRTATPQVVEVLPCPTRSMGAGECRHPCGALVIYNMENPPFMLKVRLLIKTEVIETLLYGCVTWVLGRELLR